MIQLAGTPDTEAQHRVDTLARLVRSAPRFTDALRWWLGSDLRREPCAADTDRRLDDHQALLLDLPAGTSVTYRDGYLVSVADRDFRVAAVRALIHTPFLALDSTQSAALREGTVPLGTILHGAQRATHFAQRLDGSPADEQAALQIQATLLLAGRPVALVRETVLWRLVNHRTAVDSEHRTPPWQDGEVA